MLKGNITLSLLIGPVVPVPVPKPIIDSLTNVTVTTAAGRPSGFELNFAFNNNVLLHALLMLLAQVGPYIRVIIVVSIKGTQHVLIDGLIVDQQHNPNLQTGESTLTITGTDLTEAMDLIDFTGTPYPAMPAEARVALIIAKYAMFGMIPVVIPSIFMDVPIPTKRIPTHEGTDLEYIKKLAEDAGYVFYIDPGPAPGTNKAYWGPEIKIGVPQPALNGNMDGMKNVQELNFNFSGDSKSMPITFIQNEETKAPIPIPVPDINPLNPPLGIVSCIPSRFPSLNNTANLNPVQALSRAASEASRSSDVVSGSGSLNVVKYGHILKARGLVGVRGVGEAFNGLYYVKSVTHNIKKGEYTQSFSLTRNGLVSTLPKIPT